MSSFHCPRGRIGQFGFAVALVVLFVGGCTSVNSRLNDPTLPIEHRVHNHTRAATSQPLAATNRPADHDGYFVGIAISGGGSRSANFAAACLFQLDRFDLLDYTDYISSVSGGSLTAAYYCLNGSDWNPGNVQQKLTHSFASDIILQTLLPWNWFTLTFTDYDRSDLLAEALRHELFTRDGKPLTYANLRPDRPRLLINATNLQSGRRFVFCNETFDTLNSDLAKYPIDYAVAASASFPLVFHQVTLRDFSTIYPQYRHLIDGGVTDNLGVTTLIETYENQTRAAQEQGLPLPYPHGAILIVLDARTRFDAKLSDKGDIGFIESLKTGAGLTSTTLLARAGSATFADLIVNHSPDDVTAKVLRAQIKQLEDEGFVTLKDQQGRTVQVLHLSLPRVNRLQNLPFASFSDTVNNISTYFNIEPTEAYHLYQAASLLVEQQFAPHLRSLSAELHASSPAAPSDPRLSTSAPVLPPDQLPSHRSP
jgi:predicted acylesterase/phospholipase RssA